MEIANPCMIRKHLLFAGFTGRQWCCHPLISRDPGGRTMKNGVVTTVLDLAIKHQYILKGRNEHAWQ